jgi:hypothetical protein
MSEFAMRSSSGGVNVTVRIPQEATFRQLAAVCDAASQAVAGLDVALRALRKQEAAASPMAVGTFDEAPPLLSGS